MDWFLPEVNYTCTQCGAPLEFTGITDINFCSPECFIAYYAEDPYAEE